MKTVSKRFILAAALAAIFSLPCTQVRAASTSILTGGLISPTKIALSTKGNLLVAESGMGPNTGRVSIIDPQTGARRTLLDHLPSGFSIPDGSPSGPSGLVMRGRTLYVVIGLGDAVVNSAPQGTQVPNAHPSSSLFSSVLAVHFSAAMEKNTTGFSLSLADQAMLESGEKVSFNAGGGEKLTVELVTNFPDYVPEPIPANAANVRQSNPFGIVLAGDLLYVNDASTNTVRKVNLVTGDNSTLTAFAPLANTRPFGPPVVEAVPDSIRLLNHQLLVPLLAGFPFPLGQAQVRSIDVDTGISTPFITGLTSAIDVLPSSSGGFLTLEFSANMLAGPLPGRLKWFATPTSAPVVLSAGLITPTSMVQDPDSGAIFISEIGTGRIMKVTP